MSDKDTIYRQSAIDAVSRGCLEFRGIFAECEENLNELPSAQPERKNGKWINRRLIYMDVHIATCDQCGKRVVVGNFCPHCGADMRGEEE